MSILKTKINGQWVGIPTVQGRDGAPGAAGRDGTNGTNGVDGVSVTGASINSSFHLILTLSNQTTIDAGSILPTVSSSDNGKCLIVQNGQWAIGVPSGESLGNEFDDM